MAILFSLPLYSALVVVSYFKNRIASHHAREFHPIPSNRSSAFGYILLSACFMRAQLLTANMKYLQFFIYLFYLKRRLLQKTGIRLMKLLLTFFLKNYYLKRIVNI